MDKNAHSTTLFSQQLEAAKFFPFTEQIDSGIKMLYDVNEPHKRHVQFEKPDPKE